MSLTLHKALPLLFLPFSLSLLLLVVGLAFRRRLIACSGLLCLYLASTPLVAGWLLRSLEDRVPASSTAECPNADAIVILGGMVGQSERRVGHLEWGSAVDRFEEAIALFKAGKAKLLIVPAGGVPWDRDRPPEGELLSRAAVEHGIPQSAIVMTAPVENTAGEAAAVKNILQARSMRAVILVTTAWHMPRALMLFRRAGLEVTPFPVDYETSRRPGAVPPYIPDSGALMTTDKAIREYMGLLFYRFRS